MKIIVVGSRGTLGSAWMTWWNSPRVTKILVPPPRCDEADELIGFDLPEQDVASRRFIFDAVTSLRPDVVVNATGIQQIDWLETHPNTARTLHTEGTVHLRRAAAHTNALFVQISCAEIFYADAPIAPSSPPLRLRAWREDDVPNPESVYAKTKLDAEHAAAEYEKHLIVRTGRLFGNLGERSAGNLAETVFTASRRTQNLQVVGDIITSPTFTLDLLRALRFLIPTKKTGVYHIANAGAATYAEFAIELLTACGLSRHTVNPLAAANYGYRAPHSYQTTLDTSRYHDLPGCYVMPSWKAAVREFISLRQGEENR